LWQSGFLKNVNVKVANENEKCKCKSGKSIWKRDEGEERGAKSETIKYF